MISKQKIVFLLGSATLLLLLVPVSKIAFEEVIEQQDYQIEQFIQNLSEENKYKYLLYREVQKQNLTFRGFLSLKRIIQAESNWRQFDKNGDVLRGQKNFQDIGLCQINEKYHIQEAEALKTNIYTPEGNIAYCVALFAKESGKPWVWSIKSHGIK